MYTEKHVYSTLAKNQRKEPGNLTPTNQRTHTKYTTYMYIHWSRTCIYMYIHESKLCFMCTNVFVLLWPGGACYLPKSRSEAMKLFEMETLLSVRGRVLPGRVLPVKTTVSSKTPLV